MLSIIVKVVTKLKSLTDPYNKISYLYEIMCSHPGDVIKWVG